MPTRPDDFPVLAAKKATSPEIKAMFQNLFVRAQTCAQLQDALLEQIVKNREARSGKLFRYSKPQQKMLVEFDQNAEKALQDQEALVARMDDASLLANALIGEEHQLLWDNDLYSTMPTEVRELANRILEFRKETILMLKGFIERSPLQEKIRGMLPRKKN
jgi:hypothetical protein